MFDFKIFKKQIGDLRAQVTELDSRIEAKTNEIEHLTKAPLGKDCVIAFFSSIIDRRGSEYDKAITSAAGMVSRSPHKLELLNRDIGVLIAAAQNANADVRSMESALLALLGDSIKKALVERIEAMPWPADCGPPLGQRSALIEKAEHELAALIASREEMRSAAASAGLLV